MVVFRVDILWFLERGRFMVEPFSEWVVVSSNVMYALCVVK